LTISTRSQSFSPLEERDPWSICSTIS